MQLCFQNYATLQAFWLLYGKITPTDIDGLIEYRDKAYILLEVKYRDVELPHGQRLAIERIVKDTAKAGKKSIAIVAEHDVGDTNQQVDVADCIVREIYLFSEKQWRETNRSCEQKS